MQICIFTNLYLSLQKIIIMTIHNKTGSPVEGDDFFNRVKELAFAWGHIQKGNSLILSAPRRVGKSSFAKKILSLARQEGWNTIEINLEEIKSEIGFVQLTVEKIQEQSWWEKIKNKYQSIVDQILSSVKPTIEYEGVKATLDWQSKKADVYDKLKKLFDHEKNTLIMLDEVTILLNTFLEDKENGIHHATFFLNWLRGFRQVSGTKIRWIYCSSIGIDNFTHQHHLSYTFNDVDTFPIGAFDDATSHELLIKLAESDKLDISQDIRENILAKIGWKLPFFIQLLYSKILYAVKVEGEPLSIDTVEKAYSKLITEKHLNTWDERLDQYGQLEGYARIVLNHLSNNPAGESRAILDTVLHSRLTDAEERKIVLSRLLTMLTNDGYLAENEGKYLFRSSLLKDFWFNRFEK